LERAPKREKRVFGSQRGAAAVSDEEGCASKVGETGTMAATEMP
jgi:hypothetical protein